MKVDWRERGIRLLRNWEKSGGHTFGEAGEHGTQRVCLEGQSLSVREQTF